MANNWKDWNKIGDYLKLLARKSGYATYVEGMLDLIPQLSAQGAFEDVQPGLAHLTLTLSITDCRRKIHVDWEYPGYYTIYMDHCADNAFNYGNFYGEHVTVPIEEVVPMLQRYLVRLKLESLGSVQ